MIITVDQPSWARLITRLSCKIWGWVAKSRSPIGQLTRKMYEMRLHLCMCKPSYRSTVCEPNVWVGSFHTGTTLCMTGTWMHFEFERVMGAFFFIGQSWVDSNPCSVKDHCRNKVILCLNCSYPGAHTHIHISESNRQLHVTSAECWADDVVLHLPTCMN